MANCNLAVYHRLPDPKNVLAMLARRREYNHAINRDIIDERRWKWQELKWEEETDMMNDVIVFCSYLLASAVWRRNLKRRDKTNDEIHTWYRRQLGQWVEQKCCKIREIKWRSYDAKRCRKWAKRMGILRGCEDEEWRKRNWLRKRFLRAKTMMQAGRILGEVKTGGIRMIWRIELIL